MASTGLAKARNQKLNVGHSDQAGAISSFFLGHALARKWSQKQSQNSNPDTLMWDTGILSVILTTGSDIHQKLGLRETETRRHIKI